MVASSPGHSVPVGCVERISKQNVLDSLVYQLLHVTGKAVQQTIRSDALCALLAVAGTMKPTNHIEVEAPVVSCVLAAAQAACRSSRIHRPAAGEPQYEKLPLLPQLAPAGAHRQLPTGTLWR